MQLVTPNTKQLIDTNGNVIKRADKHKLFITDPLTKIRIEILQHEKDYLSNVKDEKMKVFELCWYRTYHRMNLKGVLKMKAKEIFLNGWNATVWCKGNYFINKGDKQN